MHWNDCESYTMHFPFFGFIIRFSAESQKNNGDS